MSSGRESGTETAANGSKFLENLEFRADLSNYSRVISPDAVES